MVSYNTAELRRQNRNRVFRYIYSSETPVSKQDVAQNISLNLRELLDTGLLELQGTFDSTGGRKPKAIGVTANFKYSVGIMLSNRHIHIACIDLRAHQVCDQAIFKPFTGDEAYCRELGQTLEDFLTANHIDRERLLGVGIALPGIPNDERGVVELSPAVNARELNVELLKKHINYPCFIENDANAGGVAEWWNNSANSTMVYLSVQKGVGGAVLLDGVNYMGSHLHSGEFGHMCLVPTSQQCRTAPSVNAASGAVWRRIAPPPGSATIWASLVRISSPDWKRATRNIGCSGTIIWIIWPSASTISTLCWTAIL